MDSCRMLPVNFDGMSYTYTKCLCGALARRPPPEACGWLRSGMCCLPVEVWPGPMPASVAWLLPDRHSREASDSNIRPLYIPWCAHLSQQITQLRCRPAVHTSFVPSDPLHKASAGSTWQLDD